MSKVRVHQKAAKYLQRLPGDNRARIKEALTGLETNPLEQAHVKHMVGEWAGYHRIRVGKFRIIFWFDQKEDVIYVDHIGTRGDVYK
jgi:mRNA interferase RelE/StbE